ncbi:MAG: branched-chain amino acid ABC transporter substrate-binding protein [Actinomycetota bacterium]|nr:branched-chain amino acid ABC transporter substrate-binding protein [Actinomycetota bacterium]
MVDGPGFYTTRWDVNARYALLVIACVVGGSVASGCDSGSSGTHVAKIGVIAPLDGGLVQFGQGIRNSVQLAVAKANERKAVAGWTFEVEALDDSSDPAKGEAAARRLAADKAVIGVVGTYNSGVVAKVAPILAAAGIVMISPGNTDPALTLGPNPATPSRPYANYFRMVPNDDSQAPFLAQQALVEEKPTKVAVVSQTKPVSKGLADGFTQAFTKGGGTVAFQRVVPNDTTDFVDVIKDLVPIQPTWFSFGGEYQAGAAFRKQASAAGLTAPMMGGDGLKDDAYIAQAGKPSEGDLASTVGAPAASNPSAGPFLDAYAKAGYAEPPSDFGPYAYDAANVILAAASKALAGAGAVTRTVRDEIVVAVQATNVAGASGTVAFDAYGDTTTKVLTLYRVTDGQWKPLKTETVP